MYNTSNHKGQLKTLPKEVVGPQVRVRKGVNPAMALYRADPLLCGSSKASSVYIHWEESNHYEH